MVLPLLVAQLFTSSKYGPYSFLVVTFVAAALVMFTLLVLLWVGTFTRRYKNAQTTLGDGKNSMNCEAAKGGSIMKPSNDVELALRHQRLDDSTAI